MDGRRVGKDLFLYKDVENKITCSKGELKYRIGEGGKVMETQESMPSASTASFLVLRHKRNTKSFWSF